MQIINQLKRKEFIEIFGNIFEGSKWIAKQSYKKKPLKDYKELKKEMINIFKKSEKKTKIKILLKHPDLANKIKIKKLEKFSKNEQIMSELHKCTKEEYFEFNELNSKYKKKFGFPFILAVAGKKKVQILKIFRKRILYSKRNEFNQAIKEVIKIALFRLDHLNKKQIIK